MNPVPTPVASAIAVALCTSSGLEIASTAAATANPMIAWRKEGTPVRSGGSSNAASVTPLFRRKSQVPPTYAATMTMLSRPIHPMLRSILAMMNTMTRQFSRMDTDAVRPWRSATCRRIRWRQNTRSTTARRSMFTMLEPSRSPAERLAAPALTELIAVRISGSDVAPAKRSDPMSSPPGGCVRRSRRRIARTGRCGDEDDDGSEKREPDHAPLPSQAPERVIPLAWETGQATYIGVRVVEVADDSSVASGSARRTTRRRRRQRA